MSTKEDRPYVQSGNSGSQQAEASTSNPIAGNMQMRILVELQVISMLLYQGFGQQTDDLARLRQDVANNIT